MITITYEKDHCHIQYDSDQHIVHEIEWRIQQLLKMFCIALDDNQDLVYFRKDENAIDTKKLLRQYCAFLRKIYGDLIEEYEEETPLKIYQQAPYY